MHTFYYVFFHRPFTNSIHTVNIKRLEMEELVKMKRRGKVALSLIVVFALSTSLLSGCGNSEEDVLYGQVTHITDESVTFDIGTLQDMGDSQNQDREQRGQKPEGGRKADGAENQAPPSDMPMNDQDGVPASGGAIDGAVSGGAISKGNRPSMLELTGESKTVFITEDTRITLKGRDGSEEATIADLEEGVTISVTMSDDDTAESIEIMSAGLGKQQRQDNNDL